jgi:glycosyltransferase involved in cell wall biosynthesis
MKICIVHGYLLTSTGSNIYVRDLAKTLISLGHEVFILCQEPHPEDIDFVNEAYIFSPANNSAKRMFKRQSPYKGFCRVLKPHLNGKLFVYVLDKYEGFDTVKTFQDSTEKEIEIYVEQNAKALKWIFTQFEIEAVQANHCIMQPYITYLAAMELNIPYVVTLHGSALNFSVRKNRNLHRYMMEGLNNARRVIAVSKHNAGELKDYIKEKNDFLETKIKVIPLGTETHTFDLPPIRKELSIEALVKDLKRKLAIFDRGMTEKQKKQFMTAVHNVSTEHHIKDILKDIFQTYAPRHPDRDVVKTLRNINWKKDKIILFVGKYLWTKGVQVIITAIPLILKRNPAARFLFVGFGESREIFQALVFSLSGGNKELFTYLLKAHKEIDPGSPADTPPICEMFLASLQKRKKIDDFFQDAENLPIEERTHFTGIMSHSELKYLLPLADVFVAPSIFPEAFGTVGVEALSCGVFPVLSNHSGFKEVNDKIYLGLVNDVPVMPKMYLNDSMVPNLADNVSAVLESNELNKRDFKLKCRKLAIDYFSWDSIAEKILSLFHDDSQ